jgi:two-component system OmpR family sensor kinase
MKTLPSIRSRLAWALLAVTAAWGLAVSAVIWGSVRHEVDELLDNTLQESAEILYGLLSFNATQLPLSGGGALPAPPHEEHLVWQIISPGHEVALRSHRAPGVPLAAKGVLGFSSPTDNWRVYGMHFDDTGRVLLVAQTGVERTEARREAVFLVAGSALLVGLACALWMARRVVRELKPIEHMSAEVARFDPTFPNDRLAEPGRQELVPMHRAIVDLAHRLSRRIANERAFSAHAAHALRTPLAGIVAQLAAAQQRAGQDALPFLGNARKSADRLRRVVLSLLTMFRSGGDANLKPTSLQDLVAHLPFNDLGLDAEADEPVAADADLLSAALINLLDNSLRHGATAARLVLRQEPGGPCLQLSDNGSGLSADDLQSLQGLLDRQDYEHMRGLGLMLADLVCRAHGGRLHLVPSDKGCVIDLQLGDGTRHDRELF